MNNPEAEKAVLTLCLRNPKLFDCDLEPLDFFNATYRALFEIGSEQFNSGRSVDALTVAESAEGFNIAAADIIDIAQAFASNAMFGSYIKILKTARRTRHLQDMAHKIGLVANELISIEEKEDKVSQLLTTIEPDGESLPRNCTEVLREYIDIVDSRKDQTFTGLPTGLKTLDKRTSGLQGSDLILLAARPSMGKTALSLNLAASAAIKSNKPALFFSLEMSSHQLIERICADIGNIHYGNLRKGMLSDDDWVNFSGAAQTIKDKPFFIDDTGGLTLHQIRARARAMHRKHKLELIVIDYLQLIRFSGRSKNEEVGEISRSLKELAKELDIPILCLSQLNRGCEDRADKRPRNSDLRDSGSLEQDADQIFFLYRDEIYDEETDNKGVAELICGKFRGGEIGTDYLKSELHYQRFTDLPEDYAPAEKRKGYSFN